MKKLVMSAIIGLGLVVGFGFGNDASACECVDEHITMYNCTEEYEEHMICDNCEGVYCENYTCYCGSEEWSEPSDYEVSESEEIYMTQEEFNRFDSYVWSELYLERYCVNYCEECDIEYYRHCSCECREELGNEFTNDDELDCWDYDYMLFIEDYYELIMNIYEDVLDDLEDERIASEKEENVMIIYEF